MSEPSDPKSTPVSRGARGRRDPETARAHEELGRLPIEEQLLVGVSMAGECPFCRATQLRIYLRGIEVYSSPVEPGPTRSEKYWRWCTACGEQVSGPRNTPRLRSV